MAAPKNFSKGSSESKNEFLNPSYTVGLKHCRLYRYEVDKVSYRIKIKCIMIYRYIMAALLQRLWKTANSLQNLTAFELFRGCRVQSLYCFHFDFRNVTLVQYVYSATHSIGRNSLWKILTYYTFWPNIQFHTNYTVQC